MVELEPKANENGIVGEDIWVSGMRQAGFSDQEINRVVTVATALTESGNGHRELVPVKEAARRIGRPENTVRSWIRLGHLQPVEIPPPPDHANGPWYHVDMADVEELESRSNSQDRGEFVTLREAAERFGVKLGRLRSWYRRGYLQARGRRRGPGGGPFLVQASAVMALIEVPPRPGPQKQRPTKRT